MAEQVSEKWRLLALMDEHAERADRAEKAARDLCILLTLDNPRYMAQLEERLEGGTCPPEVEAALLAIALGRR